MEHQAVAKVQKTPARVNHLQRQSAGSSSATHPLLELQRSIGNQAVQRLILSPYIQTKLQVSTPGDPFEREADRVADTVMRMTEPEATQEEATPVQAKPLATQITPLVQREPEQLIEEKQEKTIAAKFVGHSRVPLAVREDDDEEKVATKLETSPGPQKEEKETTVATKPLVQRVPLAVRDDDDEEKIAPKLETSPVPLEEEKEKNIATKPLVQRKPLAVREDEDEEKVAPKSDSSPVPLEEEKEKTVQTKLATDAPLQRQTREDDERKEQTLQTAPPIQRQMEDEEAVQTKLFASQSSQLPGSSPTSSRSANATVQRSCTDCEGERQLVNRQPGMVQRKFAPAQLRDEDELEKQRVEPKRANFVAPSVTTSLAANIRGLQGGGSPLPPATRAFFEPRFGMDFGQVRVHTGAMAEETAKSINARAFTVGREITFGAGQYEPESLEGRRLLAHELTHTLQQSTGPRLASQESKVSNALHAKPSQTSSSPVRRAEEGEARSPQPPVASGSILQRTNVSIQRLTIPYLTTKSDEELVKDGLGGDIVAINEIRNIAAVDIPTRFKLLDRLIGQGVQQFGGRDSSSVYKIWASFGDLESVANTNVERWKKSAEQAPQLASLPRVMDLKDQFATTVRETAKSYINTNRGIIRQEQIKYGVLTFDDEKPAPVDDEQRKNVINMQSAAEAVAKNQKAQEAARQTLVGYKWGGSARGSTFWISVSFDPYQKPDQASVADYPEPKTTWEKINVAWENSVASTRGFLKKFPALYAVSRQGSSALTTSFVNQQTPEQARKFLSRAMEALIKDIQATEKALDKEGKLNPLDLTPIAEGLLEGKKNAVGSSVEWGKPLPSMAGREALKDHKFVKALDALGYTVAAEALFILAPFTGPASVFLMLGALAVLGAKAGESQQQFETLSQAAKTGVTPETELATDKEVSMAAMEAQADKAALALAALTAIGAAAVGAISTVVRASRLRALVPDPVQLIRLRQLALGDEAALLELLRTAKNPAEAEALLIKMGTIEKAMEVLSIRERFLTFRAKHQSRLDANPDLEKLVQKAENLAVDPTKTREAEKIFDDVAAKIDMLVRQEAGLPPVTNVVVDEAKFEYVFGKASPDPHNTPRTEQNVNYMNAIGLHDTAESRALLRKHLEQVPYDPKNLVKVDERALKITPTKDVFSGSWGGPTEIRESLVQGPGGSVKLQSFWEVRYGTRRLTSVRPHDVQPIVRQPNIAPIPKLQRAPLAVREDDDEEKAAPKLDADLSTQEEETPQTKLASSSPRVTPSVASNIRTLQGQGGQLPPATRAFFEPRFGADFSQVRVHTDTRAAGTAKSINAKAFTVGRDIAFGAGQYVPESPEGQRLLAHELTHVVQQSGEQLQRASTLTTNAAGTGQATSDQEIEPVNTLSIDKRNGTGKGDDTDELNISQSEESPEPESKVVGHEFAVAAGSNPSGVPNAPTIQRSPSEKLARQADQPTATQTGQNTDRLPSPVQVLWGSDPFTVSFERKKEDTDYFYFVVHYTGPHPTQGPFVEQGTKRLRVALGSAPLNASVVPMPGQQVVVDLYGFRDHLVRLVDEVKFDDRPFAFGRDHSFTAKSQGQWTGTGDLWVRDPKAKPLEGVIAEPQLPAFSSAATPVFIGGISSVDLVLGQYNDQFRISVQSQATALKPTYPLKAVLGVTPMWRGEMLYGKGVEITVNANPVIRVLSASGSTISLDLDGDGREDLRVEDAITVPSNYDGGGPAEFNRNHAVSLSGSGVPSQTFNFQVRMGSFVRGSSETAIDQKATSNAHSVSELSREQGAKGTFEEQLDAYEIAFMPYRQQAQENKLVTKKTFDTWKNLSEAMIRLRPLIDANQKDPQKNPIDGSLRMTAAVNATQLYDSLAAETLGHEVNASTEVSSTDYNPYTGESTTITAFLGASTSTGPAKQVSFYLVTGKWDEAYQSYHSLVDGLDRWIVSQMKAKKGEKDPNFQRAQAIASMHGALGDLSAKKPIRVVGVFHPDKKFANESGYMPSVPLQLYTWREGDEWYLRDITNPSEPYTFPSVSANETAAPPVKLFGKLNDPDHYPVGVIHFEVPGQYGGQVSTTDSLTWKKFFTWLGIGLAVIGLAVSAVATAGTTLEVAGAWALAGSAVAGGTAAAIDLIEGSQRGNLSGLRVALDLAQIVASIAGVTALRSSLVVGEAMTAGAKGANLMGQAGEYAVYMQKVYLIAKGTQLAADTISLAIVGVEIAIQLEEIENSHASREEKDRAKLLLLAQLAVMGGIHLLAVKGDLPLLTGSGRKLVLHFPDNQGPPVATLSGMEAPANLRFSQKDILPTTFDKSMTIEELSESIKQGWKGGPIDVVTAPDGSLVSLDNRRLAAAQMAGVKEVPVAYHSPSEPFPPARAQANEFKLKYNIRRLEDGTLVVGGTEGEIVFPKDYRPANFGEAAMIRTANQGNLPAGGRFPLWGRLEKPAIRTKSPGGPSAPTPTQLGKQIGETAGAGGNLGEVGRKLSDLHLPQESAVDAAEAALWATGMRPARPVTLDDLSVAVPIAQEGRGQPILLVKLDGTVVRAKADLSWEGWGMKVESVKIE